MAHLTPYHSRMITACSTTAKQWISAGRPEAAKRSASLAVTWYRESQQLSEESRDDFYSRVDA